MSEAEKVWVGGGGGGEIFSGKCYEKFANLTLNSAGH